MDFLYQEDCSKEKEIREMNVLIEALCLSVVKWRNTSGEEVVYIRFVLLSSSLVLGAVGKALLVS
jgi:hypothetical protein